MNPSDWLVSVMALTEGRGRTAASDISVSRLGWGRVWLGGSIGSEGWRSGIEWMLSIGGIGVDASAASGAGVGGSSAIFVASNEVDPKSSPGAIVLS